MFFQYIHNKDFIDDFVDTHKSKINKEHCEKVNRAQINDQKKQLRLPLIPDKPSMDRSTSSPEISQSLPKTYITEFSSVNSHRRMSSTNSPVLQRLESKPFNVVKDENCAVPKPTIVHKKPALISSKPGTKPKPGFKTERQSKPQLQNKPSLQLKPVVQSRPELRTKPKLMSKLPKIEETNSVPPINSKVPPLPKSPIMNNFKVSSMQTINATSNPKKATAFN